MGHGRLLIGSLQRRLIRRKTAPKRADDALYHIARPDFRCLDDRNLHAAAGNVWPGPARRSGPRRIRLDVTRDAWISEVGREADGNNGAAPRLKLKSIQEMSLLDIDTSPLAGRTIRSAVLYLKKAGDEPLKRVTVSTVGTEWDEGTGTGYAIQPGGATFRHRRHPDLPWSVSGGDICHVVLGNGGTFWHMADATLPDREDWQAVPVDPKVVAARLAGISHGFLAFDDTGSEWTRNGETFTFRLFPNRFVYSREQNRASAPYFAIEPGPEDRRPPEAPSGLRLEPGSALLPEGEALVSWVTPRDAGPAGTLGFFASLDGAALARELIPLAGIPARVEMHLRDLKPSAAWNIVSPSGRLTQRATMGRRRPRQSAHRTDRRFTFLSSSRLRAILRARLCCRELPVSTSRSSTSWTRSIP